MANNVNIRATGGMNFFHGLTLLFIGLKLCNQIDWGWITVMSPLLVYFVLAVLAALAEDK